MALPEELLLRILALALAPPSSPLPFFHPRNRTALLLVSRQFLRIASPLFYHSLHLHSPRQAVRILDTLTHHPDLASAVRRIVFNGIWLSSARILALCDSVSDIDICLDGGLSHPIPIPTEMSDVDAQAFCHALEQRPTITHLTIRKDPAVYLTHPRPIYVLQRLAQAVRHWADLETVHFALRLSASPTTLPLAHALATAPRLRCVRAQLPAVWSDLLLVASTNPCLEKVMLYSEPVPGPLNSKPSMTMGSAVIKPAHICDDIEHAVLGTAMYMMEARKHARFSELIKAGTAIIRTRATTLATLSTSSVGGASLGAIRAKEVAVELVANMHRDAFGFPSAQPLAGTAGRCVHAQIV